MAADMNDPAYKSISPEQLLDGEAGLGTSSRERYKTPDEDMATEFGHLLQLFERAIPKQSDKALFARLMNEANAKGLSWVEGLKYVSEQRRSAPVRGRS